VAAGPAGGPGCATGGRPGSAAVVFPFSTTAALDAKIATALVNLAIGVAIGTLIGGVATRSVPDAQVR